jgi:hypothetical protein
VKLIRFLDKEVSS